MCLPRIWFWSCSHGVKFISNKTKLYIKQKFSFGLEFVFGRVLMVRTRVLGRPPGILIFAQACKKLSPILVMIIRMMLLTVRTVIMVMKRIMRSRMITLNDDNIDEVDVTGIVMMRLCYVWLKWLPTIKVASSCSSISVFHCVGSE